MTTHTIDQYHKVMIQTEKIAPTASVPIRTYIAHVQHLQDELNRALTMNALQSQNIRSYVESSIHARIAKRHFQEAGR